MQAKTTIMMVIAPFHIPLVLRVEWENTHKKSYM